MTSPVRRDVSYTHKRRDAPPPFDGASADASRRRAAEVLRRARGVYPLRLRSKSALDWPYRLDRARCHPCERLCVNMRSVFELHFLLKLVPASATAMRDCTTLYCTHRTVPVE